MCLKVLVKEHFVWRSWSKLDAVFHWTLSHTAVVQLSPQLSNTSLPERYTPIQTSPNWPLPRRLMSCSDSLGISHTSLVLTDRSARRGMPLWHGTISRQHSPAALAGGKIWKSFIIRKKTDLELSGFCTQTCSTLTRVVLDQLLERLKLGPGGDIVAPIVQFAYLVVFNVVSLDIIPVLDGKRVGPWNRSNTYSTVC